MTLGKFNQALSVTIALLWLNACDTVVDSENTVNPEIETISIDQGDGTVFTVHLDPGTEPTRQFFDDLDDLHHFMDSVDASGHVFLNKSLYIRLEHALYPSEIAALDMEGIAIVGEYKYVVSEETVSRAKFGKSDTELEVETYHGINGDVYLEEFAKLARNIVTIDELEDFTFRDPEIRSLYAEIKNAKSINKIANPDRVWYETGKTNQFPFDNPITGQYYTSRSGIHERGYHLWNQSIGRSFRRSLAYTSLVFRPANTETWYPYNYGYYGKNMSSYSTTNFVITVVDGGKGKKKCEGIFECRVREKRARRTGSISWHTSGYEAPNNWQPPNTELPSSFVLKTYDMKDEKVY